jgi:hypothetical protein
MYRFSRPTSNASRIVNVDAFMLLKPWRKS